MKKMLLAAAAAFAVSVLAFGQAEARIVNQSPAMEILGAHVEQVKNGGHGGRGWNRGNRGRHYGWSRGRHYGWARGRHRGW